MMRAETRVATDSEVIRQLMYECRDLRAQLADARSAVSGLVAQSDDLRAQIDAAVIDRAHWQGEADRWRREAEDWRSEANDADRAMGPF